MRKFARSSALVFKDGIMNRVQPGVAVRIDEVGAHDPSTHPMPASGPCCSVSSVWALAYIGGAVCRAADAICKAVRL